MKLGTFIMPLHPPEKSRTEGFDEDVDFVVYADQLDFTEAWMGQHLTLSWEPVPSNDVFLANLIARTKNIILAAGPRRAAPPTMGLTATLGPGKPLNDSRTPGIARIGPRLRKGFEGQITTPDKLGSLSFSKTAGTGLACSEP